MWRADISAKRYGAKQRRNWPERKAISPHKVEIPIAGSFIPGTSSTGTMDRRGPMEQSDDISFEPLEGDLGNSLTCSGQLSASRDLEPETGGEDAYSLSAG
jgi:hypothetical protein